MFPIVQVNITLSLLCFTRRSRVMFQLNFEVIVMSDEFIKGFLSPNMRIEEKKSNCGLDE